MTMFGSVSLILVGVSSDDPAGLRLPLIRRHRTSGLIHICEDTYTYVYMYTYVYIYIYVYLYTCIYVFIYIINMYIYI